MEKSLIVATRMLCLKLQSSLKLSEVSKQQQQHIKQQQQQESISFSPSLKALHPLQKDDLGANTAELPRKKIQIHLITSVNIYNNIWKKFGTIMI